MEISDVQARDVAERMFLCMKGYDARSQKRIIDALINTSNGSVTRPSNRKTRFRSYRCEIARESEVLFRERMEENVNSSSIQYVANTSPGSYYLFSGKNKHYSEEGISEFLGGTGVLRISCLRNVPNLTGSFVFERGKRPVRRNRTDSFPDDTIESECSTITAVDCGSDGIAEDEDTLVPEDTNRISESLDDRSTLRLIEMAKDVGLNHAVTRMSRKELVRSLREEIEKESVPTTFPSVGADFTCFRCSVFPSTLDRRLSTTKVVRLFREAFKWVLSSFNHLRVTRTEDEESFEYFCRAGEDFGTWSQTTPEFYAEEFVLTCFCSKWSEPLDLIFSELDLSKKLERGTVLHGAVKSSLVTYMRTVYGYQDKESL